MMHRNSFLLVDVDEDMLRVGIGDWETKVGNGVRRAGEKTVGRMEAGERGSLGGIVYGLQLYENNADVMGRGRGLVTVSYLTPTSPSPRLSLASSLSPSLPLPRISFLSSSSGMSPPQPVQCR